MYSLGEVIPIISQEMTLETYLQSDRLLESVKKLGQKIGTRIMYCSLDMSLIVYVAEHLVEHWRLVLGKTEQQCILISLETHPFSRKDYRPRSDAFIQIMG